jgi:hypothetical protein
MRRASLVVLFSALAACKPEPEPDFTETFAGPYDLVDVSTAGGRIELSAGGDAAVEMEFLPSTSDIWIADEADGVLTLVGACFGDEVAGCSGGFLLTVPAGQAIRAKSDSGEIDFLADLSGTLDAQTASGAIEFQDTRAADATLLTGTGEVRARFAEAPAALSFDTGSSLLSVALPAGRYDLDLDTTGQQTVAPEIEDGNGPTIRLHSGTGTIDLFATD